MKVDAYRKKLERQVAGAARRAEQARRTARDGRKSDAERIQAMAAAGPAHSPDRDYARTVAADRSQPAELRAAAIRQLTPSPADKANLVEFLIARLGDRDEAIEVRSAAAGTLKLTAFNVRDFAAHRAEYLAALRSVIDVEDPTLRLGALGTLAREQDAATLRRLEEGLKDPARALVEPQKALQLLSYDGKRDQRALLLKLIRKPPSVEARRQALRNLAADARSKALFTRIAKAKDEDREARLIALSALQLLDPAGLAKVASGLAGDAREAEEVRAAALTALGAIEPGVRRPAAVAAATALAKQARTPAARDAAKLYLAAPEE